MSSEHREHPLYQGKLWIRGPLTITAETLADLDEHARAEYPSECCGFVFGPADEPGHLDASVREVNEADKYHALDPETFPRTSRTYFKINELRATRAIERAEAEGRPMKVVYHSHCDVGAYFSDEDCATFSQGGQLMWPCAFIVVSVHEDGVRDHKVWVHVPGTDAFEEAELRVV